MTVPIFGNGHRVTSLHTTHLLWPLNYVKITGKNEGISGIDKDPTDTAPQRGSLDHEGPQMHKY